MSQAHEKIVWVICDCVHRNLRLDLTLDESQLINQGLKTSCDRALFGIYLYIDARIAQACSPHQGCVSH